MYILQANIHIKISGFFLLIEKIYLYLQTKRSVYNDN
jgi:hypothetical protein